MQKPAAHNTESRSYPTICTNIPPIVSISAPQDLVTICANGRSSILCALLKTATLPEPPIFVVHIPAAMADSSGKKPTSFPRTDAVNVMIPTMSTTVIRYNGVRVFKIVFRSISVKPIPASAAAVQLLMANCPTLLPHPPALRT